MHEPQIDGKINTFVVYFVNMHSNDEEFGFRMCLEWNVGNFFFITSDKTKMKLFNFNIIEKSFVIFLVPWLVLKYHYIKSKNSHSERVISK
mgnify:CR=1 FL=1